MSSIPPPGSPPAPSAQSPVVMSSPNRQRSVQGRKPERRKVTAAILEQCLFGAADASNTNSTRSSNSSNNNKLSSDDHKVDAIDAMLEPDPNQTDNDGGTSVGMAASTSTIITYERPDGASVAVAAAAATKESATASCQSLSTDRHDRQHDSKLDDSIMTESLMDLGLGDPSADGASAGCGIGNARADNASPVPPKRSDEDERESRRLEEWVDGEDDAAAGGGGSDDEGGGVTYTKPGGKGDFVVPLKKTQDGTTTTTTTANAGSNKELEKSAHEMDTMSASMRDRLREAAAAETDGYSGYASGSVDLGDDHDDDNDESDLDSVNVGTSRSTSRSSGEQIVEPEDDKPANGGSRSTGPAAAESASTPTKGDGGQQTPPPTPASDNVPARPSKGQPEPIVRDKHVYDVNEIGSLSSNRKKEEHALKVRSAKVGDALSNLEDSASGVGLKDRWTKREQSSNNASLALDGLSTSSLDAPLHDRNNESSLGGSGSVRGLGLSSSSLNSTGTPSASAEKSTKRSIQSPLGSAGGTLPTLSEESSQEKSSTHMINLQELRRLSSQGIPEEGSHRALSWRVLMGYLPPDTSKWEAVLKRDRELYRNLVSELFVKPGHHDEQTDHLKTEGRRLQGSGMHKEGRSVRDGGGFGSPHGDRPGHNSITMIEEDLAESKDAEASSRTSSVDSHDMAKAANAVENFSTGVDTSSEHSSDQEIKSLRSSDIAREMMAQRSNTEDGDESKMETPIKKSTDGTLESQTGQNAPMPVHTPQMLVPARVREQWKESGRDTDTLAAYSDTSGHMNALLVVDDQGNAYDEHGHISPTKEGNGRVSVNDDPLSLESGSKWAQFFENASLLDEIRKDVTRTHPDLTFFLEPEDNLGQRRYAAVERVLFVWAKLNKGVRYVQGMNEIVATLYFVLANDSNEEWACEAEADTYFLFNTLMVEMRDIFVPDLDHADTGIQGRISNMIALLSLHDPEVRCHLDDCGIDGSFYSIRWLTTLLSREFILPDTIRLWDSMFASTHKDNFMRYVCVTMVMLMREELLRSDFGTCLRLLQAFPPTDVDRLLEASRALWIYESQITLACHKGGISLQQALQTIAPPATIIMAYGLQGGIALSREERMRQKGKESIAAAKEAASGAKNSAKGLFGSARQAWGEWRGGGSRSRHEARTPTSTSDNSGEQDRYRRSKTTDF